MSCSNCVKINPLPSCLGPYTDISITGITFPDHDGDEIVLKITNTATRQVWYYEFTAGTDDISMTSAFPLMQHYYKLEFFTSGVPVDFVITNPDDTTSAGCCIEFIPFEGMEWNTSEWPVSTTNCVAE